MSLRGGGAQVIGDAVAGRDFIGRDRIGDEFHTAINLNFVAQTREDATPFQAPPLLGYVSRPEATAPIRLSLLDESSANEVLLVTAVQGLGGIGKTTIAAHLAREPSVRNRYSDGTLWVTFGQQPDIVSLLNACNVSMGAKPVSTQDAASAQLRTLLQDRSVLLVLDDVWTADHARPFLAGGKHCRVLITTRDAIIARVLGARAFNLDVLTPEQAVDLINTRLNGQLMELDRPFANALARAVGYLPLALELAAVQVADGIPWSELNEELSEEIARIEILDVVTADADGDYPSADNSRRQASVRASFNLSLRRLDASRRASFAWLGILAEDVEISSAVASVLWETDMRTARDDLRLLANKSLLMPGRTAGGEFRTYRMHDLMGDLARSLLTRPDATNDADGPGGHRTLEDAHRELLRRYSSRNAQQPWYALPDDGYISAHLAWHLDRAGAHDELHALLSASAPNGANGWYEARARMGQAAGFLADVDRAWALARELPGRNSQTNTLGLQWRYSLIKASLNSLAMRVPPALLVALVRSRVWSVTEGLAYAGQIPVHHIRARSLSSLSILQMGAGQAEQGLSCALLINDDEVLGATVCQLLPRLTFSGVQEVLIRTSSMKNDFWRTHILAKSAARLAVLQHLDLATQAVHQVKALWGLAEILEALEVQRQAPPPSFLWEVEARATELGAGSHRDRLSAALARAYSLTGDAENSQRLVRGLRDEGWIALASLGAVRLDDPKANSIADQCIQNLNEIANDSRHLEAMAEAVTYLSERLRRCIGRRTLTAASRVHDDWQRVVWLRTFAPFLLDDVMGVAVSVALTCRDHDARREGLEVLMPHVNRPLAQSLIQATSELESAPEQVRRFCALLKSDVDTSFQWHQIFLQLGKVSDPEAVADDLARLVTLADTANRSRVLAAISDIRSPGRRCDAFIGCLSSLPSALADAVAESALRALKDATEPALHAERLGALATYLSELRRSEVLTDELSGLGLVDDPYWSGRARAALLPYAVRGDALASDLTRAKQIHFEQEWIGAIEGVARRLAEKGDVRAVDALDYVNTTNWQKAIKDSPGVPGIRLAYPNISTTTPENILEVLAQTCAEGDLEKLLDLAIQRNLWDVVASLVSRLAGQLRARAIEWTLEWAEAQEGYQKDEYTPRPLLWVAPYIGAGHQQRFLRLAKRLLPERVEPILQHASLNLSEHVVEAEIEAMLSDGLDYWAVATLAGLKARLSALHKRRLVMAILHSRHDDITYRHKARAIGVLASSLPINLLAECLQSCFVQGGGEARLDPLELDTATALAPYLSIEQQTIVWAAVVRETEQHVRNAAICRLAPVLAETVIEDASQLILDVAEHSSGVCDVERLVIAVGQHLAPGLVGRARALALALDSDLARSRAYARLIRHTNESDAAIEVKFLLERSRAFKDQTVLTAILETLGPHLPQSVFLMLTRDFTASREQGIRKAALRALGGRLSALMIDELLSDPELLGSAGSIEALVELAAAIKPSLRGRVVEVASEAAEAMEDDTAKSRLLLSVALLEPNSARPVTIRRAFDSASRIQDMTQRSTVIGAIAGSLAGWDSLSVVEMLQLQLPALAARTRKDVLWDICALAPVISQGDAFAPAAVFDAVVDVNRWWP